MKRKVLLILLAAVLTVVGISSCSGRSNGELDENEAKLSSLDEETCMEVLADMGVEVPQSLSGLPDIAGMTKQLIAELETDPDKVYIFSYIGMNEYIEDVRAAVKSYYGIDS